MSGPLPWSEFSHDPRRPETRGLRASDRDRDVVLRVLGEAFADGRLDRAEYDERADVVARAKTMGELPGVIADLVPSAPTTTPSTGLAPLSADELRTRAEQDYRREVRTAMSQVVVVGALMAGIWFLTGAGYFWPGFVMLAVAINVLRLLLTKRDHIDDRMRQLEKKQRKEIEREQRRQIEGGSD
ncbi:MAG: DUF1707 SHOCT-like domain-containing protein [Nocardioides sp.]